ncbi:hypothetical protein NYS50_03670 [Curtobacterium flaccumfaciens pv. flaccumfaciens]|uniref:hypothetical protein n=1 Tax=Curtobacterium flaccumfaciens TaxID=2035 RepID=UPI00217EE859|nr:hypothetical protein [Curtobacterium flaccumfaciens]MCS6546968.1 hypothetical protein [Curtobacterium flaccumfaciens pv. flaccumfaciens]
MDDARPGTGVASAGSTETAVRRQYGPPPVPLIAWSGGRAVFAFVVPFAAGLLLAGVVLLLGVPGGRVALVNGAFVALDGTGVPAALLAVGAVIAALGLGFGTTATTVVMLAAADDATAGPRDAWRWSVHHWRLVVEATLVALVAVAAGTATAVSSRAGGWGTLVIVVLLVVGAVIAAPLLLGWALLVAGVPRRAAFRRAWGSGRVVVRGGHEATATPRRALVGGAALVTVLGVGVLLLLRLLPPSVLRSSVVVAWCCVAVTGLVLIIVAIAVRGAATRNDGGRLRSPLTTDPVAGGRRARPGFVGAGVVLVPAVVFAVIVSSNPLGVVQYDAAPADARGLLGGDIADVGGRTAVVSTPSTPPSRLRMCGDASCDTPVEMPGLTGGSAIGSAGDGGLLTAHWKVRFEDEVAQQYELEVVHSRADQLDAAPKSDGAAWPAGRRAEQRDSADEAPAVDRPEGRRTTVAAVDIVETDQGRVSYWMTDVAVASSGDRPVVVGIARGGEPEGRSHLVAVFCEDVSCVEHTVRQVALPWIPPLDHQGVDVAVAPDGTAVVSLVSETDARSPTFTALRLVSFSPDGGQPVVRDLSHAIPPGEPVRAWDEAYDARVAIGGDGNPVVLARSNGVATQRLTFCADASCSSSSHTDITPKGPTNLLPAFVIDRSGRPLVAVRDEERGTLGLLSCRDARCTGSEQTTIARFPPVQDERSSTGTLAIGLTADDTPIVLSGGATEDRDEDV